MTSRAKSTPESASPAVYLALIVLLALALRAGFNHAVVFTPERVNFQDNDSWYHMRVIEHVTANWPHMLTHDPYAIREGQHVALAPLFDLVVSSAALMAGFGSPGERLIETVAAWTPALMGALVPLVVYATARRVFDDRLAALLGAALTAVLPGHFLERSRLGYVDHHVLEVLLSSIVLWLLVRAVQQRSGRAAMAAALLAGGALGAYLLAWASGAFLVAIVCAWVVVQAIADAVTPRADRWPVRVAAIASLAALIIVLLLQIRLFQFQFQVAALVVTAIVAIAADVIHAVLTRLKVSARLTPIALVVITAAGVLVAAEAMPSLARAMLGEMQRALPDSSAYMVMEAMPLASYATAPWFTRHPLLVFGTGLPVGVLALVMLAIMTVRQPRSEWLLVMTWSVFMLVSTLLRNRFGYYLVPMLGLLGGWLCAAALARAGARGLRRDVVLLAIGGLAFAPNVWPAYAQVRTDAGLPRPWAAALDWLRRSTPEPFDRSDFYLERYTTIASATRPPTYNVVAWWDYGYWIVRAARRVPVANPTQAGAVAPAAFFAETDPKRASAMLEGFAGRFVILDWELPFRIVAPPVYVMGKFESVVQWAARPASEYYEAMYVRDEMGLMRPALVFYPAYYRAMLNRLYQFHGRAVTPTSSSVMTFAERIGPDGSRYREITALRTFSTFEQAAAHLEGLGQGPHRLVGLQPDQTPVPLEPLPNYNLVWNSRESGPWAGKPAVVIYERR